MAEAMTTLSVSSMLGLEILLEMLTIIQYVLANIPGFTCTPSDRFDGLQCFVVHLKGLTLLTYEYLQRGGVWQAGNVKYELRVIKVGGMTGKEPQCLTRT